MRRSWLYVAMLRTGWTALAASIVTAGSIVATGADTGLQGRPRVIAGGPFEASGVTALPGLGAALFVDDGEEGQVYWLSFDRDGVQRAPARPIRLNVRVADMEGITTDGTFFYAVGSQSKPDSARGLGLIRFTLNADRTRAERVESVGDLRLLLAAHVPELARARTRIGEGVLNVEGLAWDPIEHRLLLGLRTPVVDGQALIVALTLQDRTAPLSASNLTIDSRPLRLPLGGDGIRGLEYFPATKDFRVIAGSPGNTSRRAARLLRWDGGSGGALQVVTSFSADLKPEGVAPAPLSPSSALVVFDSGRYQVIGEAGPTPGFARP
jgi:hypothetical protein